MREHRDCVHYHPALVERIINIANLANRTGRAGVYLPLVAWYSAVRFDVHLASLHPSFGGRRYAAVMEPHERGTTAFVSGAVAAEASETGSLKLLRVVA